MESTQFMDPDLHSSFIGCYGDQGWDNESYIEIALEPAVPNNHSYDDDDDDDDEDEDELQYRESSDNELQLRISFSSTVPFACPSSTGERCLEENSSLSDEKPCKVQKTTTIKSRVQFPAVNRFLNTILSRPEIAASRKGSNISKRMEGGGMIMKFLMKLRSKNIGALMESFLRPVQHDHQVAVSSPPPPKKRGGNAQRRKSGSKNLLGNSGVFEMNLTGIKQVIEPVNRPPSSGHGSGSSKTSPVHPREMNQMMMMMSRGGAGGECSIQAAIAHCKSSYGDGQPSDFQFQTPRG